MAAFGKGKPPTCVMLVAHIAQRSHSVELTSISSYDASRSILGATPERSTCAQHYSHLQICSGQVLVFSAKSPKHSTASHVDAAARLKAVEQLSEWHCVAARVHPQKLDAVVAGVVAEALLYGSHFVRSKLPMKSTAGESVARSTLCASSIDTSGPATLLDEQRLRRTGCCAAL